MRLNTLFQQNIQKDIANCVGIKKNKFVKKNKKETP